MMKIQAISRQNFNGTRVKTPNKSSLNKLYAAIVPIMLAAPTVAQYQEQEFDIDAFSNYVKEVKKQSDEDMLRNKVEGEQKTKSTLILGSIAAAVGFLLALDKKKGDSK